MSGDGCGGGEEKGLELCQNTGNDIVKAATCFMQALGPTPPRASTTIPNLVYTQVDSVLNASHTEGEGTPLGA